MFNFLKTSKRKIADLIKTHNRDTETLLKIHKVERQKFMDNVREVESHYKHLLDLAKQRHDIGYRALMAHKARPCKCPHCNKEIRPK